MAKTSLAPGFRFHPTDVELIRYYLRRKVMGKRLRFEAISEIDIYKFAPWDLPDKSCLQSRDLEWYFFCPRDRKFTNGLRMNRATDIGYWKTTGKDRSICHNTQTVGIKKTLIFHVGRAPQGVRTDWVMHEYRLQDNELADAGYSQDAYVLCRIFEKSGPGPKNGEQYGAPFREEDWEDDKVNEASVFVPPLSSSGPLDDQPQFLEPVPLSGTSGGGDLPSLSPEYLNIYSLLQELSEGNNPFGLLENGNGEVPDLLIPNGRTAEEVSGSDGHEMFDGLEGLTSHVELNPADNFSFPNNMNNEYALQHTLLGVDNEPYMELKDFQFPEESHCSELMASNNLLASHSNSENYDKLYMELEDFLFPVECNCSELAVSKNLLANSNSEHYTVGYPTFMTDSIITTASGMDGSGRNSGGQYAMNKQGTSYCQEVEEHVNMYPLQTVAGGCFHNPQATIMASTSSFS